MSNLWRSKKEIYKEGLQYLKNRATGVEKSILTPWPKLNDALLNGIEWQTTVVFAARPGGGKTLIKDQIINNAHALNPDQNFRVLDISLEMTGKASAVREFSAVTKLSYKDLCSANGKTLSTKAMKQCFNHAKNKSNLPIDLVENSLTVDQLRHLLAVYMEEYNMPTLITLDHTLLVKVGTKNKDKRDMISELGEFFTESKKLYPVSFVVLSQLNRNIDNPDRAVSGKYGNYILESDVFGSDALLQHADNLIGINRPGKYKIRYYGPDRFIIDDEDTLVWHFLKSRNGDLRMSFFKAEFSKMEIKEMQPPLKDLRI